MTLEEYINQEIYRYRKTADLFEPKVGAPTANRYRELADILDQLLIEYDAAHFSDEEIGRENEARDERISRALKARTKATNELLKVWSREVLDPLAAFIGAQIDLAKEEKE